jgi:hypothetical protein
VIQIVQYAMVMDSTLQSVLLAGQLVKFTTLAQKKMRPALTATAPKKNSMSAKNPCDKSSKE